MRLVAEALEALFVQLRGLEHGDLLGDRAESVDAEIGHGFVGGFDGGDVEFHPAAVGEFDETAGGGLEALEVGGGEFDPFLLPIRRRRRASRCRCPGR
jgi:hypothetical protein